MKSDLDLLIELYEAEKLSLENLIQENLKEGENLSVYHHTEALFVVNRKLYELNSFKGPLSDEVEKLERMIDIAQSIDNPYLEETWKSRVEEQRIKVQQLRNQPDKWFNDGQNIDDALFDLYELKIQTFKLYLNKEENFCIKFDLFVHNILNISIALKDLLRYENNFEGDNTDADPLFLFTGLGFKLNEDKTAIVYNYNMNGFKDATPLKIILAHWFFDVFRYFETGSAYLKID